MEAHPILKLRSCVSALFAPTATRGERPPDPSRRPKGPAGAPSTDATTRGGNEYGPRVQACARGRPVQTAPSLDRRRVVVVEVSKTKRASGAMGHQHQQHTKRGSTHRWRSIDLRSVVCWFVVFRRRSFGLGHRSHTHTHIPHFDLSSSLHLLPHQTKSLRLLRRLMLGRRRRRGLKDRGGEHVQVALQQPLHLRLFSGLIWVWFRLIRLIGCMCVRSAVDEHPPSRTTSWQKAGSQRALYARVGDCGWGVCIIPPTRRAN